jgi:hypothetical protein
MRVQPTAATSHLEKCVVEPPAVHAASIKIEYVPQQPSEKTESQHSNVHLHKEWKTRRLLWPCQSAQSPKACAFGANRKEGRKAAA